MTESPSWYIFLFIYMTLSVGALNWILYSVHLPPHTHTHTHTHTCTDNIPQKKECFGIKIYSLCDMTGYTYDMRVHLGTDSWECNWWNGSDTSMRHRSGKVEIVGHKLFVDTFFPSPNLFCYLKNREAALRPYHMTSDTWYWKWNGITFKPESGERWLHQPAEQNPAVLIMVVADTTALDI